MEHTVTLRTSHLVFAARILQIIFSTAVLVFSVTLCLWQGNWWNYGYYYDGVANLWALVPVLAISLALMVISIVGMFAYKRPNDVHWHLMLSLDWLSFVGATPASILSVLAIFYQYGGSFALSIVLSVCAWTYLFVTLVPIIRTHRLKKHKLLPPPNSPRETWYHMEQEAPRQQQHAAPYVADHIASPVPPTAQQGVRRHVSKADTTARWSGVSGADTMVFQNVRGEEAGALPGYDGPMSPTRLSMRKEEFAEDERK